jgi:hypothetical protein
MSERLDHLIGQLAAAPIDHALDQLEAEIHRGIGRRRAQARATAALTPVGVVSVGLALAMGVALGGLSSATSATALRHGGSFSVAMNLAPSTLLEGER